MKKDCIILNTPNETRQFSSRIAVAFFNALEECIKTGDISDKSLYKIVGTPPITLYSENPESYAIHLERKKRYYKKFLSMKKRIFTMAKVKGAF